MESQGKSRGPIESTDSPTASDIWDDVRQDLCGSIGVDSVDRWMDGLSLHLGKPGEYFLVAPTLFIRDYVKENFGEAMVNSFSSRIADPHKIRFTVDSSGKNGKGRSQGSSKGGQGRSGRGRSESTLGASTQKANGAPGFPRSKRFVFDSFVVGRANQLAFASAQELAGIDSPSYHPFLLYLYSEGAQGKTHLLHAIGEAFEHAGSERRLRYLSADQFTSEYVLAVKANSAFQFKKDLHDCDLLLVDDIQVMAGRERTEQEFLIFLDAMISADRRVAITGNGPPSMLQGLDSRIRSRLAGGLALEILPPDAALRRDFALHLLETGRDGIPDIDIDEKVADMLAERLPADYRVIQGAVLRLLAEARLTFEPINCALVLDRLADLLRQVRPDLSVRVISEAAARHCGMTVAELSSKRRDRSALRARQLTCYLARKHTLESLTAIGRQIGGRSHATVLHAIQRAEEEAAGGRLAADISAVERALGA